MTTARYFITGTDTDVGKTRATAIVSLALRRALPAAMPLTIVKPVQTGLAPGETGDAETALQTIRSHLSEQLASSLTARELLRFRKPADPYNAALAEGVEPPRCADLAAEIEAIDGAVVVEGAGGAAVPLNGVQTLGQLAAACRFPVLIVVGLRLGCISHTLLTAHYLRSLGCAIAGGIFVERWQRMPKDYGADVARCVSKELPVLGVLRHDPAGVTISDAANALQEVLCKPFPL